MRFGIVDRDSERRRHIYSERAGTDIHRDIERASAAIT
jgi:hypothetical protein